MSPTFCALLYLVIVPVDFVDSMDATNYVKVELSKPMGIVFEENDADFGGIFVHSLKEGGIAAQNGSIQAGDQLVAVGTRKVSGLPFDEALGAIIDAQGDTLKLVFFRGTAVQFYGPTGASQEWLDEFVVGAASSAKKLEVANEEEKVETETE
jgi:PDZ domain